METIRKTHPVLLIAAVAVTLFSLLGIGALTGVLPHSWGQQDSTNPPTVTAAAAPAPEKPAAAKTVVAQRHHEPRHVADREQSREPTRVAAICDSCGVIESVREIEHAGQGSGLGAVAGGVLGGVLGHQVGGGRGQDLATIAGAVGGAFGGNAIEKQTKKTVSYETTVRLEDGTTRVFPSTTQPGWRVGEKVSTRDGVLSARN